MSKLVFPAPDPSYTADDFPEELIWIPKAADAKGDTVPPVDQVHVPCLLMQYPSARFLIIYFHSNAEDIGLCRPFCQFVREQFQVHVLAVEYPGYGICPGTASAEGVTSNAVAALRFATDTLHWPLDSIKIFGRSIGTGPAMTLAAMVRVSGLILIAPFMSIKDIFRDRVGPLAGLVEDVFANYAKAADIRCPTLIIHGQKDRIVQVSHGQNLYKILKSRKLLVLPPDMEHNSNLLFNVRYFILPMFQFFSLPDYVFQDLELPRWIHNKERSRYQETLASSGIPASNWPSSVRSALTSIGPLPETALVPPKPVKSLQGLDMTIVDEREDEAFNQGGNDPFRIFCEPMRLRLVMCGAAACCFDVENSKNAPLLAQLPSTDMHYSQRRRLPETFEEEVLKFDSAEKPLSSPRDRSNCNVRVSI